MKRLVKVFACGAILCGWAVSSQALVGNTVAGQAKSVTCVPCHNADGNSTTALWPKLAGQQEAYLYRQLLEFKKGSEGLRPQPIMQGILANSSEQDMADLAAYFAGQSISAGQAKADLVERGRRLYFGGDLAKGITACSACHGPAGQGNALAYFPAVAGQHAEYLVDQLEKYAQQERKTTQGMMGVIAARMSKEDKQAVASFMEGMHHASE